MVKGTSADQSSSSEELEQCPGTMLHLRSSRWIKLLARNLGKESLVNTNYE